MSSLLSRRFRILSVVAFLFCLLVPVSLFAIRGVFQGRVVEGTRRETGKYIYVAGPNGYLRRVNIQKCRVRFGDGVSASDRIHSAAEYLRQDAEIRVTADQAENGEWVAVEVLILKLPAIDKASLHT